MLQISKNSNKDEIIKKFAKQKDPFKNNGTYLFNPNVIPIEIQNLQYDDPKFVDYVAQRIGLDKSDLSTYILMKQIKGRIQYELDNDSKVTKITFKQ